MDHHLVPQFYLRGFRDVTLPERQGPQVWVAYLAHKTVGLRSPKGLAQRKDYYAVRSPAGEVEHHRIETGPLQRIDDAAARVFAEVQAGDYALDADRRRCLSLFIAFLVTRMPTWRSAVESFAGEVAAATMKVAASHPAYFERVLRERGVLTEANANEVEEMRQSCLEPGAYSYRGTPEMSLAQMLGVALGLSKVVSKMSWVFLKAPPEMQFVTGDNPIHWNDPKAPPPWNVGLGSQGTLLSFPMTPSLCLMASWHRTLPASREAPHQIVDCANLRTIQFAEHHVYAASRTDAEGALGIRNALQNAGEWTGPRAPDLRVGK